MINLLSQILEYIMSPCYQVTGNYWLAIILFTLITKILLMPVSLWCQKNCLTMVYLMPQINQIKIKYFGDTDRILENQHALFKREHYHPLLNLIPLFIQIFILMGLIEVIHKITDTGISPTLGVIPCRDGGWAWIMPLCAGASAWLLGYAQNRINPLQREQSRIEQLITNGISIAISLSLGIFVASGVVLYWIFSNLFSILVQMACNFILPPEKHVDYPALRASQEELKTIQALSRPNITAEDKKREKADYKKFFQVVNKHLVFYSEASGFYKYFQNILNYLLTHSNVIIHYVTNDPNDQIFELAKTHPRLRPYYISETRCITLFMRMDADIVVMTTPDLDKFYLKRSYVRKDIEYVYVDHYLLSTHMCGREGAFDHFDTILCAGQHRIDELRAAEKIYKTPAKNLIPCGYGLLDNLLESFEKQENPQREVKNILIAPSFQEDNIMDSCLDAILDRLLGKGYRIIVRPHPEYKKRYAVRMNAIIQKYQDRFDENFIMETDFSSNVTIFTADVLITDWSGIAYEFAYSTKRPALFVNTPMKVLNPNYKKIPLVPTEITLRDKVGISVELQELEHVDEVVADLLKRKDEFRERITDVMNQYVFNIGHSGEAGGKYLLSRLVKKPRQEEKPTE
ncbi:MAG: YidC/Oxa1 family membrane protein insertase [Planctomycetia bacterium]|nr:YidC/Oxa1 family membrane protein insertase [Planctomycetia bacterium]